MDQTSNDSLWKIVLAELQLEVSGAVFNTLFKSSKLASFEASVATIAIPNYMIQRMIEGRYYSLIKKSIDAHTKSNSSIIFSIDPKLGRKQEEAPAAEKDLGPLFQQQDTDLAKLLQGNHLRIENTFDNYAVSSTNQLAFAAAQRVAQTPGQAWNPLLIYGGVGVGKTHLMQAVGQELLKKDPTFPIVFCNSEDFTNDIVEAIRSKTTTSFRNKYRRAKLLCVDDIQFIAGKETVQEEFFHTFNALIQAGSQIILTSDKAPSEIPKLEARIRSRLEGGLIIDVGDPDFELRVAILLIKAKQKQLDLPLDLAKIIATTISDTRGLDGVLMRITSEVQIQKNPLNEDLIWKILGKKREVEVAGNGGVASKDMFIDGVCAYFNVKPTQIKGKKRDRSIALPRQILMYLLRTELRVSLTEVGDLIGGRDHTTVMHAVDKISTLVASNERTREDIMGIKRLIYG